MKKAFFLAGILFISVISTACINNFAIQELNNKAKDFMDKGDYISAIERLKSSVDLDGNVFETQYNLAVAYTKAEDYANAIKSYDDASKINPDFADLYYSRAVCEENLAKDIISGEILVNDDNSLSKPEIKEENDDNDKNSKLSENTIKTLSELLNDSVADYRIYLDKSPEADREEINNKIDELNLLMENNVK